MATTTRRFTYAREFPGRIIPGGQCATPDAAPCESDVYLCHGLYMPMSGVPLCARHCELAHIHSVERYVRHYQGLTKTVWIPGTGLAMTVRPNGHQERQRR